MGELILSVAFHFHDFAQNLDMVCALSFSHPKSLPNRGAEEYSYFEQFGKGQFDDGRKNNFGCLKTFVTALSHLFLYISPGGFICVGDGELVIISEKNNTKSDLSHFFGRRF